MEKNLQSLDASLSTLIDGTTEKGAKLIEFLYKEAPDVVKQLLLYVSTASAIKSLLGISLVLCGPFFVFFAGENFL